MIFISKNPQNVTRSLTSGNNQNKGVNCEKCKNRRNFLLRQICLLFLLLALITDGSCVLTSTPSDVAVLSATNVTLRCLTDTAEDLLWYRLRPNAGSEDHIVEGMKVNNEFRDVYSVLQERQWSNLTIHAVQSTAARYACVEIYTTERATAQITVLESKPSCSANLTGDILNFTCVVTFSGRVDPSINWIRVAGKEGKEGIVTNENTKKSGNLITHTSTLTMQANDKNQVFSYRYTVKFCDAEETTDAQMCSFSQLISIGEEATTASGIHVISTVPWWIGVLIPLVTISAVGLLVGIYWFRRRRKRQFEADQRATTALVERSV